MRKKRLGYVYFNDGHKEGVTYCYIPEKPIGCFEFRTRSGRYLYTMCTCKYGNKPEKKRRWFVKYEQVCNDGIHDRFYTADIERVEVSIGKIQAIFRANLCAITKEGRLVYLE